MVDFVPIREVGAEVVERGIVGRLHVGIEVRVLNFAFPLVAPEIVSGFDGEGDKAEEDGDAPEEQRLGAEGERGREVGDGEEEGDPASEGTGDEADGHFRQGPIVEEIERGAECEFEREDENEAGELKEAHGSRVTERALSQLPLSRPASRRATARAWWWGPAIAGRRGGRPGPRVRRRGVSRAGRGERERRGTRHTPARR